MYTSSLESTRLDYLDAARAFALILGIIFHASISFLPIFIGWAVMDISTSSIVSIFMLISHSFRLELFFLIAGFFSHMKFHREKTQSFIKSRVVRIVIPFVIGWIVLRPLLVSAWIMGAESMQGEVNIINALSAGVASLGDLPNGIFVGTHLWFLYYLLIISASVLCVRFVFSTYKPLLINVIHLADNLTSWICTSPIGLFAAAVPTAACLWFMNSWGMDTPDKSLTPHLPTFLIYGGFFLFGWLLHRNIHLMEKFSQLSWSEFVCCCIAIIASYLLSSYEMKLAHPYYQVIKASFLLSYAIMMWSLVSLTIGLFKRWFDRPSKTIRYIADSSYWLYLIHLPIVIWLQIAVAELPLNWLIKLVVISAFTILISLVIYAVFVRSTFIGAVLNGKRKPRLLSNKG